MGPYWEAASVAEAHQATAEAESEMEEQRTNGAAVADYALRMRRQGNHPVRLWGCCSFELAVPVPEIQCETKWAQ